jgi:NAD(P)-dependent dehydrogenase (short-subunit alcohol dehydrogenase family)
MTRSRLSLLQSFALCAFVLLQPALAAEQQASAQLRKAVLVTGASSGIGRLLTQRLASEGHFVYAGARQAADLRELDAIANVQAIRLDVTNPKDVAASLETIRKGGLGLYGVVNNAGVTTLGSVVDGAHEEFELVMEVNAFGPYRVTKAFAPLVIARQGRIVNIGSISGILAGANVSAYSMSKHAIEAFTDSLASEMEPHGVHVSVVEPGNFNTELARNAVERTGLYPHLADRSKHKRPDEVVSAVMLALFESAPKRRYLVVPNAREAERTIMKQITRLVELNERHAYTYDRAALVRMLDAALSGSAARSAEASPDRGGPLPPSGPWLPPR